MRYFEEDAQLRDILITGGDGLMSSDKSLEKLLDEILLMARRKGKKNESAGRRKTGRLVRVRIGTRLPVYLPQRISLNLVKILKSFREKGIRMWAFASFLFKHILIHPWR